VRAGHDRAAPGVTWAHLGLAWLVRRGLVVAGAVLLWQVIASGADNPFFPPPSRIASAAAQLWLSPLLVTNVLPSLARLLGGWVIAGMAGTVLGIGLGRSRMVADYLEFVLAFLRTLPPPLLVPVFMVLCGIGPTMEVTTITFGAVWPVLLNTMDGAKSVDPVTTDTARVFRVSRTRWVLGVVLPTALPKVFAGLRTSLSIALILMVISELAGSTSGIGFQLAITQGQLDLPAMWSWIILVGLLGSVLNQGLVLAERRVLAWHHERVGAR